MEFESTVPKANDPIQPVSFREALSAISLDMVAAETSIAAALKRMMAREFYGYSKMRLFNDVKHEQVAEKGLWVRKCSVGFSESYVKQHSDWLEEDLLKWIKDTALAVSATLERMDSDLVIIDGLKVKLRRVSGVAFSLSLSLSYTFEDRNGRP